MELIHKYRKSESAELALFRRTIINTLHELISSFDEDLSHLHKIVSAEDINKVRLACFKRLNENLDWKSMILNLCGSEIRNILGEDLLIQTKLNLTILMPMDRSSVLEAHSDSWSADSPFQMNVWIPLCECFSSNSMFIMEAAETLRIMREIKQADTSGAIAIDQLKIGHEKFLSADFGDIILFNPALLHGNVVNETDATRVSLNVRVKSLFAPEPEERNPDRRHGTYYKVLNISDNTKFALDILETGLLE